MATAATLLALAAAGCDRLPAATPQSDLARYASGAMKNLVPTADQPAAPATGFFDADGRPLDLAKFKGKVVVVNLWATWCGPCVTEMPTLAALQKTYEGRDLVVLPISVDRRTYIADAKSFIGVHPPLLLYNDPAFALPMKLKVAGLPTTILYDRKGREIARVNGEAKWDSPEAKALIDHLLKQ
jgi:thiol-disulfide isomerase/thioredoxin